MDAPYRLYNSPLKYGVVRGRGTPEYCLTPAPDAQLTQKAEVHHHHPRAARAYLADLSAAAARVRHLRQ